jgi:hypothetical protein
MRASRHNTMNAVTICKVEAQLLFSSQSFSEKKEIELIFL